MGHGSSKSLFQSSVYKRARFKEDMAKNLDQILDSSHPCKN